MAAGKFSVKFLSPLGLDVYSPFEGLGLSFFQILNGQHPEIRVLCPDSIPEVMTLRVFTSSSTPWMAPCPKTRKKKLLLVVHFSEVL